MTPTEYETLAAESMVRFAESQAAYYADAQDVSAVTVAILTRALEIATPGWLPDRRASLLTQGD